MGKILLTSSQVNVIITSVIVVLCTSALFLSGYAIQQRTLHELRVAIKPRPSRPSPKVSPNLYLPERFKTSTTKLDDETILLVEGEGEIEGKQQQEVIEVELTAPEEVGEGRQVKLVQQQAQVIAEKVQKPPKVEKKKKKKDNVGEKGKEDNKAKMEEKGEESVKHPWAAEHPDPLVKTEKPISRAERRRLIKEEIRRLSQMDKPLYYQRRLW